jgi:hypothetical protein
VHDQCCYFVWPKRGKLTVAGSDSGDFVSHSFAPAWFAYSLEVQHPIPQRSLDGSNLAFV